MPTAQADEARWAAAMASRLRLLQIGCADDLPPERRATLNEEVRRGLADIPANQRKVYLEALLERFPTFSNVRSPAPAPAASRPALEDAKPEELLARLVQALPSMSDEAKQKLAMQLREANLVVVEEKAGEWTASEEFQRALRMDGDHPVNPERLARLTVLLMEALLLMDQFAWGKWSELAPSSGFKRPTAAGSDLRILLRSYLCEVEEERASEHWNALERAFDDSSGRTTKLVVEMLMAPHRAGLKFGQEFINQLSPDLIKDVVGSGGIRNMVMGNWKQDCWDRYVELFRHYSTNQAVAQKIKEAYVRAVEEKLGNRQVSSPS